MVLVDTSIWIELLNGRQPKPEGDDLFRLVTCGPVIQEVFQGLREGPSTRGFRLSFLALPILEDPMPQATFIAAADIYREGRRKGFSIRSSNDCLIAAVAIANQVPVWHRDRDFDSIAKFTPLRAISSLPRA